VQGLAVFVDDVSVTADGSNLVSTGFEDGTLAPFQAAGPPEAARRSSGTGSRRSRRASRTAPGYAPDHSLILGFGLEGDRRDNRGRVIGDGLKRWGYTP